MTHTKHEGLLCTFKVAMEWKQYVEAFFWQDTECLRRVTGEKNAAALARQGDYACTISGSEEVLKLPRKFGEVHFTINEMGAGYVAHELQHIMLYYIQALKLDLEKEDERICHLFGCMTCDFWKSFYENFEEVKSGPKG